MVPVRPVLGQIVQNEPRGANLAFGSIWLSFLQCSSRTPLN